eukprot:216044_1
MSIKVNVAFSAWSLTVGTFHYIKQRRIMALALPNINKATIQVRSESPFPSIPLEWADRFDVRIWNNLESVCNEALTFLISNNKPKKSTFVLISVFSTLFMLGNVFIFVFLGVSDYQYEDDDHEDEIENSEGLFIASLVFYGLCVFVALFICPCRIYRDVCSINKNEEQTAITRAIRSYKKKGTCTFNLIACCSPIFVFASVLIIVWAASRHEYCCVGNYGGDGTCEIWCDHSNYQARFGALVFYGLCVFVFIFICPCVIHSEFYSVQQYNPMYLEDMMQKMYFGSLNTTYQHMLVFHISSVHIPSIGAQCCTLCASADHQSNAIYIELEIEMKVQKITYIKVIADEAREQPAISALPTQQQVRLMQTGIPTPSLQTELVIQQSLQQKNIVSENQNNVTPDLDVNAAPRRTSKWMRNALLVKEWLDDIGMTQYYDCMISNGYDTMDIIKEIKTNNDLEDIGIDLKGHQALILSQASQLRTDTQKTDGQMNVVDVKDVHNDIDVDLIGPVATGQMNDEELDPITVEGVADAGDHH